LLLFAVVLAPGLMVPDLAGAAAPVDDSAYENIGMGGSGGIFAPGASPVDPDFMLTCSDMTGCYRSDDGGRTWHPQATVVDHLNTVLPFEDKPWLAASPWRAISAIRM